MIVRLQKFLAEADIASRRKAEKFISDGRIAVNGNIITEMGFKIDDEKDVVTFDNKVVEKSKKLIYIMFHKPEGCVTTAKDQYDRKTVLDYIKDINERLYPVGRLDYNTSGLLILTNDGDLTYKLTHPKHNVEKVYIAKVEGEPSKEEMKRFREGLFIDGYKTSPAKIYIVKKDGNYASLKIIINEGRNRQVRKMCEAINHNVKNLKRIATGNLFLGDLKKGNYRYLTENEIKYLKSI